MLRRLTSVVSVGATLCAGFVVVQPPSPAGIAAASELARASHSLIVAQVSLQDEGDDAIAAVAAVLASKTTSSSKSASDSEAAAVADEEETEAPARKLAVDVDLALSLSAADRKEVEAEANEVFDAIDQNGDGYITRDELAQHLTGTGYSMRAIDGMFGSIDSNADGKISRAEMQAAYKRYESSSLRLALGLAAGVAARDDAADARHTRTMNGRIQTADELFSLIDTNGDGEISLAELRAHLGGRGYASATVDTIFSLLDVAPKDGIISRDELRRCFETYEYSALRLALMVD